MGAQAPAPMHRPEDRRPAPALRTALPPKNTMTRWFVCLPLLAAACAPAAGTPAAPGNPRVVTMQVENEISGLRLTQEGMLPPVTVPVPQPRAWTALRAAFDSVGLPVRGEDEAAGTLSTGNFTVNGRLKTTRLSRFLSCGTQRGMDNADSYEVVMAVASQVTPAGDATRLATSVQGWAQPRGDGGTNRLTCSSTGQLEARLAELLRTAG